MKTGEQSLHASSMERGTAAILKYTESISVLNNPCPRETVGLEPNLLGFYQSLTDVREEKYPTTVPSSFLCGGTEIINSSLPVLPNRGKLRSV